eukprot:g1711.t1
MGIPSPSIIRRMNIERSVRNAYKIFVIMNTEESYLRMWQELSRDGSNINESIMSSTLYRASWNGGQKLNYLIRALFSTLFTTHKFSPNSAEDISMQTFYNVEMQYNKALEMAVDFWKDINTYRNEIIGGAGDVIAKLRMTRDVSFAIVVAYAAAVAAPMAAAKAASLGVGVGGQVVAGAAGGAVAAGGTRGMLSTTSQYLEHGDVDWAEVFDEMKEAALSGAMGGAAGTIGSLSQAALVARFGELTASSSFTLSGQALEFAKGVAPAVVGSVMRQLLLSTCSAIGNDKYTTDDFKRDIMLAILFAGFAHGTNLKSRLGNGGIFDVKDLKFNDIAVTAATARAVWKIATGIVVPSKNDEQDDGESVVYNYEHTTISAETASSACVSRVTCCALSDIDQAPLVKKRKEYNHDAKSLQSILNTLSSEKLKVDGLFGPATEKAVKSFQERKGLHPIDGIVGKDTWEALCQASAAA